MIWRRPSIGVGPHQPLPVIWLVVIVRPILISKGIGQLPVIVSEWIGMQ